jgi:hypothetical protein
LLATETECALCQAGLDCEDWRGGSPISISKVNSVLRTLSSCTPAPSSCTPARPPLFHPVPLTPCPPLSHFYPLPPYPLRAPLLHIVKPRTARLSSTPYPPPAPSEWSRLGIGRLGIGFFAGLRGFIKIRASGVSAGGWVSSGGCRVLFKNPGFYIGEGFTCAGLGGAGANCLLPQDPEWEARELLACLRSPRSGSYLSCSISLHRCFFFL